VGNALEVVESCDVLRGDGPDDLRALTLALGAEMLLIAGTEPDRQGAVERLERILDSGAGFRRFERVVEAQGGDPRALSDPARLPSAANEYVVRADRDGVITHFDCADVGRAAGALGAGRATKEDKIIAGVGLEVLVERGDRIVEGDPLVRVRYDADTRLSYAVETLREAIHLGDDPPAEVPLIMERVE